MPITPTQLRANLYKVLDQVIETQQPIAINRNGQIIKIEAILIAVKGHDFTIDCRYSPDSHF